MSSGTLSDPRDTRAAGTLSRKHSQTLTQLARDAPSSALARKRVLPNTKGDLTEDLQQVTSNKAGKSPARRLKKQPFKRGGDASSKRRPNLTARKQHSDRATEVLERWFWDNFYPTEQRPKPVPTRDEKLSLAAATGLSERQVADWFVNARARKWKPRMEAIMRDHSSLVGEDGTRRAGCGRTRRTRQPPRALRRFKFERWINVERRTSIGRRRRPTAIPRVPLPNPSPVRTRRPRLPHIALRRRQCD